MHNTILIVLSTRVGNQFGLVWICSPVRAELEVVLDAYTILVVLSADR
jgi:hypothetical protein